ncbi:4-hydroxy-tetrahydrodipicolinate synthase [Halogranum amylolyticum]|uniref:4-hydroxy-tetrahydrodipicolinate synthase n=1 Tax=Halogranum amylolyticum TaxID=660520 RepID=A0A1H8WCQ4_9EURY|nr:dihydrodipicolinate synthase family protein [Halogranum amylolyticum]SEP25452.1 4-hydroxy-tetrahydrodipicolinate synthase [Halogranum amylolyticum]
MPLAESEVKERLRGVAAGLLTPFDKTGDIEYWKITENAESLYESGLRTFLAAANISEYHSLSQTERTKVTEASLEGVPSDACVLAGVGGSTDAAQELVHAYDRLGVDAHMVMPPDHTYVHELGLLDYFDKIAAETDTPFVPYIRGFDPSVEFLADLTRLENVVGIKYAIKNPVKLGAAIAAGADDVVWVNGLAEPYAVSYWAEGIEGFSAGVSNFRPEVGLELFDALTTGDWERARLLRNACLPYQNFRDRPGQNNTLSGAVSVPAVKLGLELAGLHGGDVREPIRPLAPEEEAELEEIYHRLDDDIERLIG